MPPDAGLLRSADTSAWRKPLVQLAAAWFALLVVTHAEWAEMAHQWWDIDTYSHILLVPPILAWLVWLRRRELANVEPRGWWPGLLWTAIGLVVWLAGRLADINLVAQAGTITAFQGAAIALLGLRTTLVLAFPLLFAGFLVPFGDEMIPPLQMITARMTVALTHLSGVEATIHGYFIDTPAGRFVVAEECSGVKFLIAMVALATLVAWTGFARWRPRLLFVAGAAIVSILANGLRAWATIFVAQYVGAERAGGFDHIVYGWIFFAVVIAIILALGWRHFDREPGDAGLTAAQAAAHPLARSERLVVPSEVATAAIVIAAIAFALIARLV